MGNKEMDNQVHNPRDLLIKQMIRKVLKCRTLGWTSPDM